MLASTLLQRSDANEDEALQRLQHYLQLAMVSYAKAVLAQEKELQHMLSAAAQPTAASQLVAALNPQRQPIALRSLVWLMKLGLLRAV